jgi:hypothetical protein
MISLQKSRDETTGASFPFGARYVNNIEAIQIVVLRSDELSV